MSGRCSIPCVTVALPMTVVLGCEFQELNVGTPTPEHMILFLDLMKILKLPIYLNCLFFKTENDKNIYVYKIEASGVKAHPFQLFKLEDEGSGTWRNLSVYAIIDDAIMILLKELFTTELRDEIIHGQATVNPAEIMEKINRGDRSVSLYGSAQNEMFRLDFDVDFETLIERR